MHLSVRALTTGSAEGLALVLAEPLSFWGGVDAESGEIIDRSHPDRGVCLTGRVLVMPGGRGSSSSSSVLAETVRRGTGPVAIVLTTADPILAVGSLVASALYDRHCPIVVGPIDGIRTGVALRVEATAGRMATVTIR